jgi:MFS family permease
LPARWCFRCLPPSAASGIFAGGVFLFQMANASMLPLAGEALAYSKEALSSLIVAALIMVPQVIVAIMAPWVGRRANTWGRRPLLLVGFAALPIRALVFSWTTNPTILVAAQILEGVSGTMLGVLTALIVADLTTGTGRFNLAQGFVGTMSGIGASLSTTLSGLVAKFLGRASGFLGIAAVALAAVLLLWCGCQKPIRRPRTRSDSRSCAAQRLSIAGSVRTGRVVIVSRLETQIGEVAVSDSIQTPLGCRT